MSFTIKNTESFRERREIHHSYMSSRHEWDHCIATILEVSGSSFRKPGSVVLFSEDGSSVGSLSGGCIERDIFERSQRVFKKGKPEVIKIATGSEEDDLLGSSTGCEGELTILVEKLEKNLSLTELESFIGPLNPNGSKGSWLNIFITEHGVVRSLGEKNNDARYSFYHRLAPQVVVFGKEGCAPSLVDLCLAVGIDVTWIDHRLGKTSRSKGLSLVCSRAESFDFSSLAPHSFMVLSTHNLFSDAHILAEAQKSKPIYIGLVGSRARLDKLSKMTELKTTEVLCDFKAPAGNRLTSFMEKNHSPEHVAMAIFLEIQKKVYEQSMLMEAGVSGVILAAGKSRRFCGDKQKALVFGRSLLRLQAEKLDRLPLKRKAVFIRKDLLGFARKELADLSSVEIVAVDENSGMGDTLALAASYYKGSSGLLVSLVDQPLIPLTHYLDLLLMFSKDPNTPSATKAHIEMAPAVIPQHSLSLLMSLCGDRGARQYLAGANLTYCDPARYDIDSGDDLMAVSKIIEKEDHRPRF